MDEKTKHYAIMGAVALAVLVIVAILAVGTLFSIGLLGWFPGISGGARETQSKAYWTGAMPISITEYNFGDNAAAIVMRNEFDAKITVKAISLNGQNLTISHDPIVLRGGETRIASATMPSSCGNTGDGFEYTVVIYYDTESLPNQVQVGDQPLVGKCM